MKKAILIIACALISATTFAQDKTVTNNIKHVDVVNIGSPDQTAVVKKDTVAPAKPEFKADPNKVYDISLKLNAAAVYVLTTTPEQWAEIRSSSKYTGEQITGLERLASAIRQEIVNQQNAALQKDYIAFMQPAKPIPKKGKK